MQSSSLLVSTKPVKSTSTGTVAVGVRTAEARPGNVQRRCFWILCVPSAMREGVLWSKGRPLLRAAPPTKVNLCVVAEESAFVESVYVTK